MSKYKLLTFIVLGFLAFTLTACTLFSKDETKEENSQTQEQSNNNQTDVSGSLMDLLKMNAALVCDSNYEENGTKVTSKSYLSGNKLRAETMTVTQDKSYNTYMIADPEWMYMWGQNPEDPKSGIKISNKDFSGLANDAKDLISDLVPQDSKENVDEDITTNSMNYKCKPWVVDNNLFTPPTDVTFISMDESFNNLMDELKPTTTGLDQDLDLSNRCSICDMVPEASAKAECKIQFSCQ